jgi:hypothetical protein
MPVARVARALDGYVAGDRGAAYARAAIRKRTRGDAGT